MFKGHPKGLFIAFFANMGERFGFYTMVSIFILFIQAKYGMTAGQSSFVYSIFVSTVYAMPLIGGLLADKSSATGRPSAWHDRHVHRLPPPGAPDEDERGARPGHCGAGDDRPGHGVLQGEPPGPGREPL